MSSPIARPRRIMGLFAFLATFAGVFMTTGGTASATTGSSSQELAQFTVQSFQYVADGLPAGIVRPAQTTQDTCKTFTFGVNVTNSGGNRLITFIQDVPWCYNGTAITFHDVGYRAIGGTAGWQYDTLISESHQAGSGKSFYRDAATARVKQCLPAIGCIAEAHPWISTVVRANGQTSGNGGW